MVATLYWLVLFQAYPLKFQSLSGFLMVATPARALDHGRLHHVSIPIGFSNGCNRNIRPGIPDIPDVSIPIGFSNGCNVINSQT